MLLKPKALPLANLPTLLDTEHVQYRTVHFTGTGTIFKQGDTAQRVFWIQEGNVKLVVMSAAGKEAIVAILRPGDFFGEGCMAGQPVRMATAVCVTDVTIIEVEKAVMVNALAAHAHLADRFLEHMLQRNIRIEEDLVDQLFNSSEKRLARTLLLLARYGDDDASQNTLPVLSHSTLADMVGTTRSRVNFFMNKFRRLGYIDYNGKLTIHKGLLSVVLHD